jgi:glycosyltransferase involved in cell wall biosynthesis
MKEKVTVAMAHYNTPEFIPLSIALWSNQTVPCEIWLIDTGSDENIERFASEFVKIVNIPQIVPFRHVSETIAVACQYVQDNCTTKYLMQTHVDVFPKSKYLLEYWLSLMCNSPVVGYGMSDRSFTKSVLKTLWQEIVGHSLTMVDVHTMWDKRIEWSLQKSIDKYDIKMEDIVFWDTEVTFGLELKKVGIKPFMVGRDKNFRLLSDCWHSHLRSYTTGKLYKDDYTRLLKVVHGLGFDILQKEFEDELIRLKEMLLNSWKVNINKFTI